MEKIEAYTAQEFDEKFRAKHLEFGGVRVLITRTHGELATPGGSKLLTDSGGWSIAFRGHGTNFVLTVTTLIAIETLIPDIKAELGVVPR